MFFSEHSVSYLQSAAKKVAPSEALIFCATMWLLNIYNDIHAPFFYFTAGKNVKAMWNLVLQPKDFSMFCLHLEENTFMSH